eukprot:TRINITY_DN4378_c0_g1_i2.p1 TRINITY_DN4378_c0_g1~~TRINITY_DN4378_c0_g1_i2.p1  ORF type:complete len:1205 (-),score=291.14 TRINITY_DN4378_c0_g1_i2:58-3672(-)
MSAAAAPMPPGKVATPELQGDGSNVAPLSPGVVQLPDAKAAAGLAGADPTALFKVANGIVCALAYEAAKGQSQHAESAEAVAPSAEGKAAAKGGKAKASKGSSKAAKGKINREYSAGPCSTPQKPRQNLSSPTSPLQASTTDTTPAGGDGIIEEFDDYDDVMSSFTGSPQSPGLRRSLEGSPSGMASGKGGGGRPQNGSRSNGFRRPRDSGERYSQAAAVPRAPLQPQSGSLKALPARPCQDFLARVQEGKYSQAVEVLREIRAALGNRGRSKEAFGGMRALLHYLLESYGCYDHLDQAMQLLEEMRTGPEARLVSNAALNALLRGLLARSAYEQARWVVRREMPRLGVVVNEATLNLLMDTAARSGPSNLEEAWNILEEMQNQGMKADKYTVSILTKHISDRASDKKRVHRGVALVEHFLRAQPEDVDEVLVNSLLDVFCRMGDMPRLEATLTKMKEYGIKGSAVTYGTIVKAYGRANNIDKVVQAWDEMQQSGLEANAVTYGCMLDACVKCGHLERAIHIFDIMKTRGIHRNTILYATLIKGFAKSKDPMAARTLYKEMVAEGVVCNVVVFNSLIDACVRANDQATAAEVLQEMTASGVLPDVITFSTLIKGYCSSGELVKALRLQEELVARDLECDEIVYNSLLEGCVKAGDLTLGLRLFNEMRQKGVRPSAVTFSILVKLLSRAGRLDLGIQLVAREMREVHGVAPTRMVWSCLVTCCVKTRDLSRAVMALELLDADGAASGTARASMYATAIEGGLTSGEVSTALQLVKHAYLRAPAEDASRALLSLDLLKRVFEAASAKGPEAEAQGVLNAIAARLSDQVLNALEEVLGRGSSGGAGGSRLSRAARQGQETAAEQGGQTDTTMNGHNKVHGDALQEAMTGWSAQGQPWGQQGYPAAASEGLPGVDPQAAAAAAMSSYAAGWEQAAAMQAAQAAMAAGAMAAAAATGYSWPQHPGFEGYRFPWAAPQMMPSAASWPSPEALGGHVPYGMMPPFAGYPAVAPAPYWQPEGMQHYLAQAQAAAACAGSMPGAAAACGACAGLGPAEILTGGHAVATASAPASYLAAQQQQHQQQEVAPAAPQEPDAIAAACAAAAAGAAGAASVRQGSMASSPGPLSTTPATPAGTRGDASKGLDAEQTPATTAGRSSMHRSPAEEEEKEEDHQDRSHTPLQKMLFGGGETGGVGTPAKKDMLLEGPPGLC